MKKVITYGTYDLLHYGHIRLLERAKALGDYLIVGVTADDFDKTRGKINVQQSLMERIEAVRATGIADEIIIEEYEGQKIDDIRRYNVDIFTVGSDWVGVFDYLKEYCDVVYLDRTKGISSSEVRSEEFSIKLGLIGDSISMLKHIKESSFVNGLEISGVCSNNREILTYAKNKNIQCVDNYESLLNICTSVYILSHPTNHYDHIKKALQYGKHVLYESPMTLSVDDAKELIDLANKKDLILMESIKTAYSTAYNRLSLLVKSGRIGDVISIDSTCTSLSNLNNFTSPDYANIWNSICAWGPTAMLPIFQIMGVNYTNKNIVSLLKDSCTKFDIFTKVDFIFEKGVASIKVGKGVKSEGELVISGTKGYIYVPAPWWKTDYFEIRYENPADNKRYFYQLDGEGIRYELVAFVKSIKQNKSNFYIDTDTTLAIVKVVQDYYNGNISTILQDTIKR